GTTGAATAVDEGVLSALVEEIADGDVTILDDLIPSYLDEAAEQVTQLEEAAVTGDASTVSAIAHSLKSASAVLGALPLADLLRQAETTAREQAPDLPALVEPIRREFTRAADVLTRLRPQIAD